MNRLACSLYPGPTPRTRRTSRRRSMSTSCPSGFATYHIFPSIPFSHLPSHCLSVPSPSQPLCLSPSPSLLLCLSPSLPICLYPSLPLPLSVSFSQDWRILDFELMEIDCSLYRKTPRTWCKPDVDVMSDKRGSMWYMITTMACYTLK